MLDLDESLRALYFAPFPLLVLDHTRCIRMINKTAETILGTSGPVALGMLFEKFVAPNSQMSYTASMNDAAEAARIGRMIAGPTTTRIGLADSESSALVSVDMSVTAWYQTSEIYDGVVNPLARMKNAAFFSPSASMMDLSQTPGAMAAASPTAPNIPLEKRVQPAHEAFYTVSLMPARMAPSERSTTPDSELSTTTLRNCLVDGLDVACIALSKDGKRMVRNIKADELLADYIAEVPWGDDDVEGELGRPGISAQQNFAWLEQMMVCYVGEPDSTGQWDIRLEGEGFPIYRAAVKGERVLPMEIECVSIKTGKRKRFEVEAKPLREMGGLGKHIGGMITFKDVAEYRNELEAEVTALGEEYFRTVADSLPIFVWISFPDGAVEWFNKTWYDFTGAKSKESLGLAWSSLFHEDDRAETFRQWGHSLRTGDLYNVEYRCRHKSGQWRWLLGRALPIRNAQGKITKWIGTCTDIHDQIEALATSRQSQAQLESVINHAAVTIWAVDRNATITVAEGPGVRQLRLAPSTPSGSGTEPDVSSTGQKKSSSGSSGKLPGDKEDRPSMDVDVHPAFRSERATGEESETHSSNGTPSQSFRSRGNKSMIGRSLYEIWDSPSFRNSLRRALDGEEVVEEMELEGRWFRTQYTPLRQLPDGSTGTYDPKDGDSMNKNVPVVGVVGASMDITERRRAENRLEESRKERLRALASETAAKEASRLKSEFLANMSHEIRTPIAGVIGLAELLIDTPLSREQRDYAENIQRSADALLTVINDVLDFSKIEVGKLDIDNGSFNLNVLTMDMRKMLSFATQKKGLELIAHCELPYTGLVIGDAGRLRQVLTNLLTNAIKFTSTGSIALKMYALHETDESIEVRFDVEDTGCGISEKALRHLFQPFRQADSSTARKFGGSGLGLSISKNLVELMGGKIGLTSKEGAGSTAWFSVSFKKARPQITQGGEEAAREATLSPTPASASGSLTGVSSDPLQRPRKDVRILVAEDNLINQQIAMKTLKMMGFNCKAASNGKEAISLMNSNPFDLVLMDCQMPEMDGYEATMRLRASQSLEIRSVPIIALTASAIRGDKERCLEAGMSDYLSKPVKRPALENMLVRWLFDAPTRQTLSKWAGTPTKSPGMLPAEHFGRKGSITSLGPASPGLSVQLPAPAVDTTELTQASIDAMQLELLQPPENPANNSTSSLSAESGSSLPPMTGNGLWQQVSLTEAMEVRKAELLANPGLSALRRASAHDVNFRPNRPSYTRSQSALDSPTPPLVDEAELAAAGGGTFRRSSREQAGLGRDIAHEFERATSREIEPSLAAALESPDEDAGKAAAASLATAQPVQERAQDVSPKASPAARA